MYSEFLKVGFKKTSNVQATSRINEKGEMIIYWTDGVTSPRFYNITKDEGFEAPDELNIFPSSKFPIDLDLIEVDDFGGSLISGAYQFAARYVDDAGNISNFTTITKPIDIVRGIQRDDFGGDYFNQGNPVNKTSKSIKISANNLDESKENIQIAAIRYEDGGIAEVNLMSPRSIIDTSMQITYTGNQGTIDGSIEEILIDNTYYETAKYITQVDDTLYMGNMTKPEAVRYQKYANAIKTNYTTKVLDLTQKFQWAYGDETLTYFNKSFRRDEVYAFYISFVLVSGQETMAFHIPGGSEGGMREWINSNEFYPDTDDWDVVESIADTETITSNLRNQNVKHHRFPTEFNVPIYQGEGFIRENVAVSTIGVKFSNIYIPDDIREKVVGIKLYMAKKDNENKLILDQGLMTLNQRQNWGTSTTPYGSYENRLPEGPVNVEDVDVFSCVPFSTKVRNSSIASITHIQKVAKAIITSRESYEYNGDINNEVNVKISAPTRFTYDSNDPENLKRRIKAISNIPADTDSVNITNLGFEHNKKSTNEHSSVLIASKDPLLDIDFNLTVGNSYGPIVNLMQDKSELYSPFDLQELVLIGEYYQNMEIFSANPSIAGGTKATGFVTISGDAPTEIAGISPTATFEIQNEPSSDSDACTGSNLNEAYLTYKGTDYCLPIIAVTKSTLATIIVNEINSNIPGLDAINLGGANPVIRVSSTDISATDNGETIVLQIPTAIEDNGAIFTPNTFDLTGGRDRLEGSAGNIAFSFKNFEDPIQNMSTEVFYDQTKIQIAQNLAQDLNNDDFVAYSATVDISEGNPVMIIEANAVGSEWNGAIYNTVNDPTVSNVTEGLIGGSSPGEAGSLPAMYGGDTYINKFGYRIGGVSNKDDRSSDDYGTHVVFIVVESYDNIAFRQSGNDYGELNGNNLSQAEELILLEENHPDPEFEGYIDNYLEYDLSHSVDGHLVAKTTPYPKKFSEIIEFPNRVIRSKTDDDVLESDLFRVFLAEDYLDLPKNRGEITNLEVLQNILIAHMRRGLFKTRGREELVTADFRAFLGNGNIFAVKPDELFSVEEGYAGLQHSRSSVVTPMGYFFVDQQAKKVFSVAGKPIEISEAGMRNFFEDNLVWHIDELEDGIADKILNTEILMSYDPEYKRIILTKRDWKPTQALKDATWSVEDGELLVDGTPIDFTNDTYLQDESFTISYLPEIQRWVSFHSYVPNYMYNDINKLFTVNDGIIYDHKGIPAEFYGTQHDMIYEYVGNEAPKQTKLVQNVEFLTYAYNPGSSDRVNYKKTFDGIRISNELQDTGFVDLIYFTEPNGNVRNIDHTWKVNKFRDLLNPDTGEIDNTLPAHEQKKLTGKYAIVRLYYTPEDARFLRLLSSDVNFKPHHR